MDKKKKRILALVLALVMVLSVAIPNNLPKGNKASAADGHSGSISFATITPTAEADVDGIPSGAKGTISVSIGRASHGTIEDDFAFIVDISPRAFNILNNFESQSDGSLIWRFETSGKDNENNDISVTIQCELKENEEGHTTIYIRGVQPGQTTSFPLTYLLNENTDVGDPINVKLTTTDGTTPLAEKDLTHLPSEGETITISNSKTSNINAFSETTDSDSLPVDITYTVSSTVDIPESWKNSAGLNSLIVTDTLSFDDNFVLNDGKTWNDLKSYISVSDSGILADSNIEPVMSGDKVTGIKITRTVSADQLSQVVTEGATEGGKVRYNVTPSTFTISEGAPVKISGTGTMVNEYKLGATSKLEPDKVYDSTPARKSIRYDQGNAGITLDKSVSRVAGDGSVDNTGANYKQVRKGNIVVFNIELKNNSVEDKTYNLLDEMSPYLSLATPEQLAAVGINASSPVIVNGSNVAYTAEATPNPTPAGTSYNGEDLSSYKRNGFSVTIPGEQTYTGIIYAYVNDDVPAGMDHMILSNYIREKDNETNWDSAAVEERPDSPDLDITKTVKGGNVWVKPGDTVTYEIKVSNEGYASATGVNVVDHINSNIDVTNVTVAYSSAPETAVQTYTSYPEAGILVDVAARTKDSEIPYTILTVTGKVKEGAVYNSIDNEASIPNGKKDNAEIFNPSWDVVGVGVGLTKSAVNNNSSKGTNVEAGDTVNYTINIKNDSAFDIDLTMFPDGLDIHDILPEGLKYVPGSIKYNYANKERTPDSADITVSGQELIWHFKGVDESYYRWDGSIGQNVEVNAKTWFKGDTITITLKATVDDTAEGTLTNTAYIVDQEQGHKDTADVIVPENTEYELEKYITRIEDSNHNLKWEGEVKGSLTVTDDGKTKTYEQITTNNLAVDDYVRYEIKVTNPTDTDISSLKIYDDNGGVYGVRISDENGGWSYTATVKDSSGNIMGTIAFTDGGNDQKMLDFSRFVPAGSDPFVIRANDYITISYLGKIASIGAGYIRNTVYDESKLNKYSVDTRPYPELKGSKTVALADRNALENQGFTRLTGLTYTDNAYMSPASTDKLIIYKLRAEVKSVAKASGGFTIHDTLGEGLKFVTSGFANQGTNSDAPVVCAYCDAWGNQNYSFQNNSYGVNVTTNGRELTITSDSYEFDGNHKYFDFYVVAELEDSVKNSAEEVVLGNDFDVAFNFKGINPYGVLTEPGATAVRDDADVTVGPGNINASHSKSAVGAFNARTESKGNGNGIIDMSGDTVAAGELADSPTAGDTIIWRLRLTNEVADDSGDMVDYVITDTLPYPYTFDDNYKTAGSGVKFYPVIKLHKIDPNNSSNYIDKYYGGNGNSTAFIEPEVTTPSGTSEGSVLVWDTSKASYGDDFKLKPGEYIEITFSSDILDGKNGSPKVYTNYSKVSFENGKTVKASNDGYMEPGSDTVNNDADISLGGTATASYKTIHYENQPSLVDSPKTDTGYGHRPHNYVKGMRDDIVTYTINMQNISLTPVDNICMIDRMPYVGDVGVIDSSPRNSAFDVKWQRFVSAKVYRATESGDNVVYDSGTEVPVKISFAANIGSKTVVNSSDDWLGENDVFSWHNTYAEGDRLIRFEFDDSLSLNKSDKVEITFEGYVPGSVTKFGETNLAWNDFAYSIHPFGSPASTVETAEPQKVGVWVEGMESEKVFEAVKTVGGETPAGDDEVFEFKVEELNVTELSDITASNVMQNSILKTGDDVFSANGSNAAGSGEVIFDSTRLFNIYGVSAGTIDYFYRMYETSADTIEIATDKTVYILKITYDRQTDGTTTISDPEVVAKFVKNDGSSAYTKAAASGTPSFDNKKTVIEEKKGTVKVEKVFDGLTDAEISSIASTFKITNDYNGEVFTINGAGGTIAPDSGNGSATSPYVWTIEEVPEDTVVEFTETGFAKSGYTVKINDKASTVTNSNKVSADPVVADDTVTCSIVNKYTEILGSLTIKKQFDTSSDGSAHKTAYYVTIKNGNDYYDAAGKNKGTTRTEISVPVDETGITIPDLPLGTYIITEVKSGSNSAEAEYYDLVTTIMDGSVECENGSITLDADNTEKTATIINKYTRQKGNLEVKKTVIDDTNSSADIEFDFTVYLYDGDSFNPDDSINGTFGGMTFNNGVATFKLKGGESIKATGLPAGIRYGVMEEAVDGYKCEVDFDTAFATIPENNATATVELTNTKIGQINITKKVDSTVIRDKTSYQTTFPITVTLYKIVEGNLVKDTDINGQYGAFKFVNGEATYNFGDEDTMQIVGLPAGTIYKVTEQANEYFDSVVKIAESETDQGMETDQGTATSGVSYVTVTNTRKTGDLSITKTIENAEPNEYPAKKFKFRIEFDKNLSGEFNVVRTKGSAITQETVTFNNSCVINEILIANGETVTIEDLPAGMGYTITEAEDTEFISNATNNINTIIPAGQNVSFKNIKKDGLVVSKTVISSIDSDKTREFTFKVTILNDDNETTNELIDGTYGEMTFDKGVAEFTLTDGESKKAKGLPDGTIYRVEETNPGEYFETYHVNLDGYASADPNENPLVATGTITDGSGGARFTNVRRVRDIIVKKIFEGIPDGQFPNAFQIKNSYNSNVFNYTNNIGAVSIINLGRESNPYIWEITNVPLGSSLTVTENGFVVGGYSLTVNGTEINDAREVSVNIPVVTDETGEVVFTNKYTRETGSLKIGKTVEGKTSTDKDINFGFKVTILKTVDGSKVTDTAFAGTYGDVTFTSGVAEFSLKDSESVTISGLPTGTMYKVEETPNDLFVSRGTNAEGTIAEADKTIESAFTNTHKTTSVKVDKRDIADGSELEGAIIYIYEGNVSDVVQPSQELEVTHWTSTADGAYEISGLEYGVTYTLRENTAPAGYDVTADTVFRIKDDGSIEIIGTGTVDNTTGEEIIVINDRLLNQIAVRKMGYINEECSERKDDEFEYKLIPLPGAEFAIYSPDDTGLERPLDSSVSDVNGVVVFNDLPSGEHEYLLAETGTVDGYKLSSTIYHVYVNEEGNVTVTDPDGKEVTEIINDLYRTNINLLKVSEKNPEVKLPGSAYVLYRAVDGGKEEIARAVTDSKGSLRFAGVIAGNEYIIAEAAAPDGYYVSEKPVTVRIVVEENEEGVTEAAIKVVDMGGGAGGSVTASVDTVTGAITWLEPEIECTVTKLDPDGKTLAGAALEIREESESGRTVASWTSTDDKYTVETGTLVSGKTYYLIETKAPEGYKVADPVRFTVDERAGAGESEPIALVMVDEKEEETSETTENTTEITTEETTEITTEEITTETVSEETASTAEIITTTETGKSTEATTETENTAVKTSDDTPVGSLMIMMIVSIAGMILFAGKKKKNNL